MRKYERFELGRDATISLGVVRIQDEEQTHHYDNEPMHYYDNEPIITLRPPRDVVSIRLLFTAEDGSNEAREIIMNPKRARKLRKVMKKHLKKFADKIEGK